MKKINVLEKHIAELIAAGEVVERPLSVVKELVENSIDAGATRVTIEIKNGGTKYIKISDNGSGIFREDVKNAFLRHATSKVKTADDLDTINTLGFRGEALASICAVSKVEVITCAEGEEIGTRYLINGGEEQLIEDIGCAKGTTFIIRDLFYNTPARMKFLKKDIAEANSIAGIIDRIAVSHPEISFKFIRDGKETLNTSGDGKLSSCIYTVYGKDFFNGMVEVDYKLNGVCVKGFVSKPLAARPTRTMQHFFINGRYVKTKTGCASLEEAFKNYIMVGKHPYCVLNINIPCETVDVNVHPSKIEVRFINEKPIFDAVYYGVKSAIMNLDEKKKLEFNEVKKANDIVQNSQSIVTPRSAELNNISFADIRAEDKDKNEIKIDSTLKSESVFNPRKIVTPEIKIENPSKRLNFDVINISVEKSEDNHIKRAEQQVKINNLSPSYRVSTSKNEVNDVKWDNQILNQPQVKAKQLDSYEEIKMDSKIFEPEPKIVGEVFNCYIIVQCNDGEILIVDKHAAHERIIYEKLKKEEKISDSQVLLEPVTVVLDKAEYAAVLDNLPLFSRSGYDVEDFGMGSVIVRSVPVYVGIDQVKDSIIEIASYILSNKKDLETSYMDWLYHNMACRAAIKGGKSSSEAEIIDLVDKLRKNPDIKYCPHGRPVSVIMKKKDIEKQFGRT